MSANNATAALAYCRLWHHVDATNTTVGRMASAIAHMLLGKHKPIYHPAADCGDYVVVTNCAKVKMLGRQWEREEKGGKVYYRHSGYPGGLKTSSAHDLLEENPNYIVLHAVKGMLPKNRLRKVRLARLKLFPGPEHPFTANLCRLR